jgi:hypothetical protein
MSHFIFLLLEPCGEELKKTKRKMLSTRVDDFQIAVEFLETANGWQGFVFASV